MVRLVGRAKGYVAYDKMFDSEDEIDLFETWQVKMIVCGLIEVPFSIVFRYLFDLQSVCRHIDL